MTMNQPLITTEVRITLTDLTLVKIVATCIVIFMAFFILRKFMA